VLLSHRHQGFHRLHRSPTDCQGLLPSSSGRRIDDGAGGSKRKGACANLSICHLSQNPSNSSFVSRIMSSFLLTSLPPSLPPSLAPFLFKARRIHLHSNTHTYMHTQKYTKLCPRITFPSSFPPSLPPSLPSYPKLVKFTHD